MTKIHLVSFADGPFAERGAAFKREAEALALFDSITVHNWSTLETEFAQSHKRFAQANPRGFGYWVWKPQVTLQALAASALGDVIIYMDVGFELNANGRYRFVEYIQLAMANRYQQLAFSNTHTEYRWTKQDLATRLHLNADSVEMLSTQLAAGFFILVNNHANKALVLTWREIAVEQNYHLSDDTPSLEANHAQFIEHRHDASIFSLLRKINGTYVTHYEVQKYPHFDTIKTQLPAWASRKK